MVMRDARSWLALAAALAVGAPAAAQSITSIRGLGYPIPATDARTAALGGLGIGLQGMTPSLDNPASLAFTTGRGAVVSVAAVEQSAELDGISDASGATRFPLIQLVHPIGGVVLTAGYGAYLDQSWGVTRESSLTADGRSIAFRDVVRSSGGIGELHVGVAVPLSRRLAVGAAVGAHTGSQRLRHQRLFDTTSLGDLQPFTVDRRVRYLGPMAQLGVQWDPLEILRIGASVKWSGTLAADSADGLATDTDYDLPLQVAGGVSAYLAPSLLATAGARWSGWGSTGTVMAGDLAGIAPSTGTDTWEVGAGLEYQNPSPRAVRTFPIRLGYEYRQLPFTFGPDAPTEWWASGGIGMRMGPSRVTPLVRLDLAVQRGERTAPTTTGELAESAWRFALSLAIFGN